MKGFTMRRLIATILVLMTCISNADDKIKMNYSNEELSKVIENYSKATGQKFIVDPAMRGKISIFIQEPVSKEEAFNHLSSALAVNGYAISKQGDTMVIKSSRNIQRDLIEVSTEVPSLKPERMYSWVYTVKNIPAESIYRELRILTSKDGELVANSSTNQLIISDWTSNLNRISELLKKIDKPLDPATAKIVESGRKEHEMKRKERASRKSHDEQNKNN